MDFADLLFSSREHLAHFCWAEYPDRFAVFSRQAAPFFEALTEANVQDCAAGLIASLEKRLADLPGRERKECALQVKQVMAFFLGPAALRYGGAATEFAECLCRNWNRKFPRNTFQLGDFDTIQKGFDTNFLGIPLRKSR